MATLNETAGTIPDTTMLIAAVRAEFVWLAQYAGTGAGTAVPFQVFVDLAGADDARATISVTYETARSLKVGDPYTIRADQREGEADDT